MARILVVDDDQLVLTAISEILLEGKHEVIAVLGDANGAAQALDATYDLLLTDIFLPWLSGWELIKAVRRRHPNIPVVAISGGGMGFEADAVLELVSGSARTLFCPNQWMPMSCWPRSRER